MFERVFRKSKEEKPGYGIDAVPASESGKPPAAEKVPIQGAEAEAAKWAADELARITAYVRPDNVDILQVLEFSLQNQRSEVAAAREAARERRSAVAALQQAGREAEARTVAQRAEEFEWRAAAAERRAGALDALRRLEQERFDSHTTGRKDFAS